MYGRALGQADIRALASENVGGLPVSSDWAFEQPPAGKYLITQSEYNGVTDDHIRQIELTGLAPLPQRPWFMLSGLVGLFGLVFLFLRLRYRQRERLRRLELENWKALEAERGRIARDLHDDLGSGISAISLLSEVARQKSEGGPVDEEIRQLASASHDLSVRIREIIWMISARNDRLDYLVSYFGNYVVELFENSSIELNLRLPEAPLPPHLVGGEQRRALFHAFKEALHLVATQTGATQLECSFHLNGKFEVRVEFTGGNLSLENTPKTALFRQLVKKWRETGGHFSATDGPTAQLRFGLAV